MTNPTTMTTMTAGMSSIDIASQGVIEGIPVPLCKFSAEDAECKASTVSAYLGIPFAQPPVGTLRWKRPQRPAPSWRESGIRQSQWRNDPIQDLNLPEFFSKPRRDVNRDEHGENTLSEDCLYLNIWVPSGLSDGSNGSERQKLPVLVWVYGGSFIFGSASQPGYDGARLCNETGCIVVSVTYRVGLFGFLGSRELAKQEDNKGTGNCGAWDVIAALEWIQENISAFAGDTSNVTVFGESAGAILLHYLLLSPETPANIFSKAILESGTAFSVPPRTLPSAQATFDAIVSQLGVSSSATEEEKVQAMYKASAEDLMEISSTLPGRRPRTEYHVDPSDGRPENRMDHDQSQLNFLPQSLYSPVWDGFFVAPNFLELAVQGLPTPDRLRNGQSGILLGYCVDEGTVFNIAIQSHGALQNHVSGFHSDVQPLVKQLYGVESCQTGEEAFAICAAYSGDLLFQVPIRSLMLQLARQTSVPSFGYLFAHRPSRQMKRGVIKTETGLDLQQRFGTLHTAELPFVFGVDGTEGRIFERETYPGKDKEAHRSETHGFTPEEQKLSLLIMRAFSQFAQQQTPWTALNDRRKSKAQKEEDCHVLAIGAFPLLGSPTPLSIAALETASKGDEIPLIEQSIGTHLTWTQKVGPSQGLDTVGTTREKQTFWAKDGFKNILMHYYGDSRITFLP